MEDCLTCIYADWSRTKNSRLHPDKTGKCKYPIPEMVIPKAYYFISGKPRPNGGYIERGKPHIECPTWASQQESK